MDDYMYRAGSAACSMEFLEFETRSLRAGENALGETGDKEAALTILKGSCVIYAGDGPRETGARNGIFAGISPHVAFLPARCTFKVSAKTPLTFSIAKTAAAGNLKQVTHVEMGAVKGFERGAGQTRREVFELTPQGTPTNLLVYEVFTPGGNWSSFPPHKHDTETDDERLLQEVYYFSFDPPEGFALIWLSDDDGRLDKAYSARDGDLVAIPRGYHTMCVSPGYTCSTHCVMAGPSNEWKIKVKPAYRHLLDWKR
jgi:5-deoxy-glucuronate isomerase